MVKDMGKDIIERLIEPTDDEDLNDAVKIIRDLRYALHRIGFDYVELSYDKVQYLYQEHIKIAREAYQKSFSPSEKVESKPLDDNF